MVENLFTQNVPGMTEVLAKSCVGIAGCGGLGSNAATALVRSGIGRLIIADMDIVEHSNLNRQLFTLKDIGKYKASALADYLNTINPNARIDTHVKELTPQDIPVLFHEADVLIEALDRAERKLWIITSWTRHFPSKPLVCGNGIAGYGSTETLKVTQTGNIYFCGDLSSDMDIGLCAARVAIVANMQANVTIELLMKGHRRDSG